ncbi:calpain-like protease PalBory [Drepanopeziza brunnea f. sp. 'multigermtubi' MB_m1]|uniref:Calpain-like protease PalBory n=1 Tax=Marssonina brunnea f. sp. multigermtubi (strain MB_m1) TaxID=1072389 RepID=K1WWK2_MARBU|nr:calpain-like protease PalBory [Drepanopeziza brunnea f. sp. 'multigermtubi' MB_m1]EKD13048.1 calpain-like protease PalBory [Drepanopeziza brunnea f. sp. 'multigermtubi' MB_m1]
MEAEAKAAESSIDTSLTKEDALKAAIAAAELYMKATSLASNDRDKTRLKGKCKQLISRAEEIKKSKDWIPVDKDLTLKAPVSRRAITRKEELILLEGSKLHGFIFPPWTGDPEDSIFEEEFDGSPLFNEPGDLSLSECQIDNFGGWKRPSELFPQHAGLQMTIAPNIDLVQDITTDCSVVASLCAATARAVKGHGTLLASITYPCDKLQGRLRVSKNGKYIFRLHFNGCFRKVVIDDRLPSSNTSRSLHVIDRNNPHLLWPALIEKAYLKVRGGYDFPGSNSGTDLWVITGWIPEQVFLRSDDLQPDQLWARVYKSFGFGDIMVTLGTGKLSLKEEKALGLAGQHDYAILDIKEVGSQHFMLVKNPWCDGMVWKGSQPIPAALSSNSSWTSDLKDALPSESMSPGTFWMTFEDVSQHFESLYLNWNPGLFKNREDHHFSWTIPSIQTGSFIHNPQYAFSSSASGPVWIMLSRHFATGDEDIARKSRSSSHYSGSGSSGLGFTSLYIFSASGRRVYLSDDAIHRGAFVDSPQTLATIDASPSESYTIVVAQHGLPLPKYSFTLSFFSRYPLAIDKATDSLPHCTTHTGSWTLRTAGGNASAPTYPSNPQFSISLPSPSPLTLILETDQEELAVHVKLVWADGFRVSVVTSKDIVGGSGDYRRGCALATLPSVAAGKYTIVCSTFEAGQTGNFTLRIGSQVPCTVLPLPPETAGRLSLRLPRLVFQDTCDRMLAPLNASRLTKLRIIARSPHALSYGYPLRSRPLIKLSIELGQGPNKCLLDVSANGEFSDSPMGIRTRDLDLGPGMGRQGGCWVVVERLGGRGGVDEVEVEILSDAPVEVGYWGTGDG